MKYRIVSIIEVEGKRQWIVDETQDVVAYMSVRNAPQNGVATSKSLRVELQGQPKFDSFAGPMWGGEEEGQPVIRYENWKAYDVLST